MSGQIKMKLATLCYVRRDGQTLMIHRVKKANDMHAGRWNGLGGKLNPGESPEECAIREIYEESGLKVRNPQLKGFLTFPAFSQDEDWYVFVYVVEDIEGELIDSAEGDLRWGDNSDLTTLNLWEGDPIFLPWLDKPGIFSGKFIYKDGRLVSHEDVFYG
jgi:8-oxo-dGTP diphosphatase